MRYEKKKYTKRKVEMTRTGDSNDLFSLSRIYLVALSIMIMGVRLGESTTTTTIEYTTTTAVLNMTTLAPNLTLSTRHEDKKFMHQLALNRSMEISAQPKSKRQRQLCKN